MAEQFGLTSTGFNPKRWDNLIDDIKSNLQTVFPNIDLNDQSVNMQFVGAFTVPLNKVWEEMQKIYLSQDPNSGEGVSLENIGGYIGMQKLPPQSTVVSVGMLGTNGTIVTEGTILKNAITQDLFTIMQDVILDTTNMTEFYVNVIVVIEGNFYGVDIGGTPYQVEALAGWDGYDIMNALGSLLNSSGFSSVITDDNNGLYVNDISSEEVIVIGDLNLYTPGFAASFDQAPIAATVNSITEIVTPISGFTAVNNLLNGLLGRELESDADFRIRRAEGLQIAGAAVLESIVARMKDDITGAGQVRGYENRTDAIDGDGRTPHSIEIIIEGGSGEDIGNLLWLIKGGGVQTLGDFFYDVTDSNGDIQRMFYSRPVDVLFYMQITLTLYDEEIFPTNGIASVTEEVLKFAAAEQTIGKDVLPQRYYEPIFRTPGIGSAVIEVKKLIGDAWQETVLPMGDNEVAILSESNLSVSVAPS